MADTNRIRASDAEREQVAHILRAAMGEGRLTLDEGEERLARGYAAQYRDEFAALTDDLPGQGRDALATMPEVRRAVRRHQRVHALGVLAVAALFVGLWVMSGGGFFWPVIPIAFLTLGYFRHRRWAYYRHHRFRH